MIDSNIPKIFWSLLLLLFFHSGNAQYKIYGYIDSDEKTKIVYLSLLKYNETNSINPDQIISSVKTDSLGYFEFSGEILPEKNNLYRVHTNINESSSGFTLYTDGENTNYYNFIFSNSDTLYFPINSETWFGQAINTNLNDLAWHKLIQYELSLRSEYRKLENQEILASAKQNTIDKLKLFMHDSLSSPLVKLLAFSYFEDDTKALTIDFKNDPLFYGALKEDLYNYYDGKSYYLQFQEEFSKLSYLSLNAQYKSAKRLNYILSGIIAFLLVLLLISILKSKTYSTTKKQYEDQLSNLTVQEKKIVELICQGQSNKDIAAKLFISLNTVKSHISNLYAKMNVANRKELVKKLKDHTGY